jgi:hypothetical protein
MRFISCQSVWTQHRSKHNSHSSYHELPPIAVCIKMHTLITTNYQHSHRSMVRYKVGRQTNNITWSFQQCKWSWIPRSSKTARSDNSDWQSKQESNHTSNNLYKTLGITNFCFHCAMTSNILVWCVRYYFYNVQKMKYSSIFKIFYTLLILKCE